MYPPVAPWSQLGQLDNEISRIKSQLNGKVGGHELSALRSDLDSLERSVGQLRTDFNALEYRLQRLEEDKLNDGG